jgi:nicotinamide-nucleotide amidase
MATRTLLLAGVSLDAFKARASHLCERFRQETVSAESIDGTVKVTLGSDLKRAEAAAGRLLEMETAFCSLFGDDLVGVDVDGLPAVVLDRLRELGASLATAESCTGGLVSAWLTEVPGASDVFRGGAVTYTNEAKEDLVAVPHELLVEHGAVSAPVAKAMAEGVRKCFAADWGISVTGIAGPGGGTAEKPVGLVHWAVAGPSGVEARHRVFSGDRSSIRRQSAASVLDQMRRQLDGKELL